MSQEPDWMQEGISADEYFEEYFSDKEINFSLKKKPQKKKTSLNNKLIIITLVFMFAFCGWLIYENTLQRQSIKGLTAQNESLQEEADKVAPLRESYDRIYEKFEELQKENNILEMKHSVLEKEHNDTITNSSEYQTLLLEYTELQSSFSELETQYNNLLIDNKDLTAENKSLNSQLHEEKTKVTNLMAEKSSLKNQIQNLQTQKNKLANQIAQIQSKPATPQKSSSTSNAAKNNTQTQNIPYKQNYHGAVYITRTGECYHYESPCGRGTYYKSTWAVVNQRGLRPCEKCVMH